MVMAVLVFAVVVVVVVVMVAVMVLVMVVGVVVVVVVVVVHHQQQHNYQHHKHQHRYYQPNCCLHLQQSYQNFNFFWKYTLFCFRHTSVKFYSNSMILDIFQQPRRRAFPNVYSLTTLCYKRFVSFFLSPLITDKIGNTLEKNVQFHFLVLYRFLF